MSGNKIKADKRKKEFDPSKKYENKWAYRKNNINKRHIENPNVYEEDTPKGTAFSAIRLPRKGRKTAWKRFRKSFPYITVTRSGGKRINEQKLREFHNRQASKKTS